MGLLFVLVVAKSIGCDSNIALRRCFHSAAQLIRLLRKNPVTLLSHYCSYCKVGNISLLAYKEGFNLPIYGAKLVTVMLFQSNRHVELVELYVNQCFGCLLNGFIKEKLSFVKSLHDE